MLAEAKVLLEHEYEGELRPMPCHACHAMPCPDPQPNTLAEPIHTHTHTRHTDLREQASVREARLHEQLAEVTNDLMVLRLASADADAAATRLPSSSSLAAAASTGPGPGPLPAEGQEQRGKATGAAMAAPPPASPSKVMRVGGRDVDVFGIH